ncbi:MAG: esterase [Polyangiaceae bacterium]|nr:esterase [Polyangiaceae bacterium]
MRRIPFIARERFHSWALLLGLTLLTAAATPSCRARGADPSGASSQAPRTLGAHAATGRPIAGQRPSASGDSAVEAPSQELVWDFPESPEGPTRVVVSVPAHRAEGARYPVLVAFHGKGEALKGPERGARGWVDDYRMHAAIARLHAPPLTDADLHGFVSQSRLSRHNRALASTPYRGLIVVMPYTPVSLGGEKPFEVVLPYGRFLVERVLPRVYRETPAVGTAESTGIDGVSLGGRVGLLVGLQLPKAFAAVSVLQAAFDSANATEIMTLAREARANNPKLVLRLVTSEDDYFRNANQNISRALSAAGVAHELVVVPGPHDYEFNRGPGVIEMLLFHDRVLRGLPAP